MELVSVAYRITINLVEINTVPKLHSSLKGKFGFPDFYGNNVHALIDCLSHLRYEDYDMVARPVSKEESITLVLVGVEKAENEVLHTLILAVGQVNQRYHQKGMTSAIYLEAINK